MNCAFKMYCEKSTTVCQARAVYEFHSDMPGELSFVNGESLVIIRQDIGDGWWEARKANGQQGLVPEAYLQITSVPEPTIPPPPPPTIHQQPTRPESWRQSGYNKPNHSNVARQPSVPSPVTSSQQSTPLDSRSQDNDDDWDDDWSDDDDSSTTTETQEAGGQPRHGSSSESYKMSTVRKPFSKFSHFSKQGGENYLFGLQPVDVPASERTAEVIETADGPCWRAPMEAFRVTVDNPKKEAKYRGMKSFITYKITPSNSGIKVSRRYKHFDWLHGRLEEKYTVLVIPPLPDKQIAGRFEEDFIQERMRQLQLWMDRLCKHPVILNSGVFNHFLSCTDDKQWKQGKRNAEKDDFQGGKFFLTVGTPQRQLDPKEVETKMDRYSRFIKSMDDSTKQLFTIGENNMKKHHGPFKKEFQKLGGSFVALAKSFEYDERPVAQELTKAIHHTGKTYETIGQRYEQQPRYDMIHLLEGLLEYKGMLSSLPDVVSVHRAAQAKIQENAGKLDEKDLESVHRRADVISFCTMAEMDHFQNHRVGDFKEYMEKYLTGQIAFFQKVTQDLQATLDQYTNA